MIKFISFKLGEITITPEGARGRFDPWTIDIDIIQNNTITSDAFD
jgi:hypothetical protein